MAKYSSRRTTTIFIKHHGAVQKSVYFRVNPQALRVQQGNKGSVVDTLGGYFREILYAKDPQYSGLMLPDLTIECDTGAGYREELKKFEWIWRHHGDRKSDGSPADTFLMDFADDTVGWNDGGVAAGGMRRMNTHQHGAKGNDLIPLGDVGRIHGGSYTLKGLLNNQAMGSMQQALIRNNRGSRFLPRVFKIELLNFAWDETVQDPFRIRFNFRCKILRDMLWKVDPQERTGRTMFALAQAQGDWQNGQVAPFENASLDGGGSMAGIGSQEYPLNLPAHAALTQDTLNTLEPAVPRLTQPANDSLGGILGQAGLGQNRVAQKIFDLGRSVFGVNQPIYPQGNAQGLGNINTTLNDLIKNLPQITTAGSQTLLQAGGWTPPQIPILSELINFDLPDLSFFQGLTRQAVEGGTGDAGVDPGPSESDAYPFTRYGEIRL